MKKLYSFKFDCGRMGDVTGLFVADEKDTKKSIGQEVYLGEVLGKHSEIRGPLAEGEITMESEDVDLINKLVSIFGENISGYNPLDYIN